MEQIDVETWEAFEEQLTKLRRKHRRHRALVFRGLADSQWPLTTTLERYTDWEMPFMGYYRTIAASEPQIRTFTRTEWDPIDSFPDVDKIASQYDSFDIHLWGGQLRALGYMAYLRHHGFPSPLMDWTRSPYIAAFFAFRPPAASPLQRVSIFAYCEEPASTKSWSSGESRIFRMGPHVRTARRHHLQQGEYTMCLLWNGDTGWRFVRHETVFDRNEKNQDALWKFTVPWTEREKIMRVLDDHNVNAFSLFESDDALLETLALRRFVLEVPPIATADDAESPEDLD
jgi:hypothetical protein